jgi:hypothetical protein
MQHRRRKITTSRNSFQDLIGKALGKTKKGQATPVLFEI